MYDATSRTLARGNGRMSRAWRLVRSSPTLIARGLAYPEKRTFVKKLVNTYHEDCINLSLVFPGRRPWRLRWLALRAVGVYLHNTVLYNAPRMWRGFDVYNADALARALAHGKGVVVAGQHLGPQRYSFSELGTAELKVVAAMTELFIGHATAWVRRVESDLVAGPQVDGVRKVTMLAVEERTCALKMMRALRRQEAVMFDLDGNIGVGGEERTLEGSILLSFLGRQVHVRHGVAYLGYRSGAPVLPVIALWGARGRPEMHYFEPILAHEGESLAEFSQRCLKEIYGLLEAVVLEHPAQWEMWPHFFKWLPPPARLGELDPDSTVLAGETEALASLLERTPGSPVAVKPENAFVMRIRGKNLFVDAVNHRYFFVSPPTRKLLKRLHAGSTLGRIVREVGRGRTRDAVLLDLARFRLLNLLETTPAQA